ncbi:F-box/LRR-repeat protein 12 [Aegotheles albertisi]
MAAPVAALPDSVLLRVLELLPVRDRLRAARVCRRWRQLALDRALWTDVDLRPHRLSSRTLWLLLRRRFGEALRTLRLRGSLRSAGNRRLLSPALLAALGQRCPHLRRLVLTETDLRPVPYDSLPPSLTALELHCCEIPGLWFCGAAGRALPRLQRLLIHNVPAFSDRHLLNVSSRCRLTALSLAGTYRLTDTGVEGAAPCLGQLELLVLQHCAVGDSAARSIGRHLKRLRFLELRGAHSLTDAGLARLATLEHLETLSLDLGDKISPGAVVALCRALPRLSHVRFGDASLEHVAMDKSGAAPPRCGVPSAP